MTIDERLKVAKEEVEKIKREQMEVQAQMAALDMEKGAILAECNALEVPEPKKLTEYIGTLEKELLEEIRKAEEVLQHVRQR